jgi:hypothetical protein
MRKPLLPGRHVTDSQMRIYMTHRQTNPVRIAAAKSGFSGASEYRLGEGSTPPFDQEGAAGAPAARSPWLGLG